MGNRFVGCTLLVAFSALTLILARLHQRPLCINSQYIEKITFADESTVFRCTLNRVVPYSAPFRDFERMYTTQIFPFEQWLRSFVKVRSARLQIVVSKAPVVTRTEGRAIHLWDSQTDQGEGLQREIAKSVLKQAYPTLESTEALADFYVQVWNDRPSRYYGDLDRYVSHQWWRTYKNLRLRDKIRFLSSLPQWSESHLKVDRDTLAFDHLVYTSNLSPQMLGRLEIAQKRAPHLKLGLWDGQALYHMPSRSRVSADSFRKLHTRHFIWESCQDLDLESLFKVPAEVQKLLVVRHCDPQQALDYRAYFLRGVEGFAAQYPQVAFVRLDIPSLRLRQENILLQQKIFDLMSRRQVDNPFFLAYGWQEITLDSKLQIYTPRAYIDAVESFRVR